MKLFALLLQTFLSTASANAFDLKPGDILVQSQPCFLCSLIEIEEGLPYSHAGVVVQDDRGSWAVLEAWNQVERVPLDEFLSRRRRGTETLRIRPPYRASLEQDPRKLNLWIQQRFQNGFAGHSYDPDFLWNNGDEKGESYYCSELVAKLLNPALIRPLTPKPMHFEKNRDAWIRYFRRQPPDGLPGLSPADIVRQF